MPVNIIPNTEDFSAANWLAFVGASITINTFAPPAFAGLNATFADKIEDPNAAGVSFIRCNVVSIPLDSSSYIASLFIRKDAVTSRFPALIAELPDGTGLLNGISVNTQTGAIANYFNNFPAILDKGVVDVDSLWWRAWLKFANDGTSSQLRLYIQPCQASVIGDPDDATLTGFITGWGVNVTNTSSLVTYDPDPFYVFTSGANPFFTTIGAKRMG